MKTIKRGSKGEEVVTLQRALGVAADGVFGAQTEAAVKAFQRAHGLSADGVVGAQTWAALKAAAPLSSDERVVSSEVVYMPLSVHVSRSPGRSIKYLAIHFTAGSSSAAGAARSVRRVFEQRRASADFAVDDAEMVQFNPDLRNYYCWAVGDKKAAGVSCPPANNRNTVSIEICSTLACGTASVPNHEGWLFKEAALANAARLARLLMAKFDIPIERVVRHYDISGKLCPGVVGWNDGRLYTMDGKATSHYNDSAKWEEFKKRLI